MGQVYCRCACVWRSISVLHVFVNVLKVTEHIMCLFACLHCAFVCLLVDVNMFVSPHDLAECVYMCGSVFTCCVRHSHHNSHERTLPAHTWP